MASLYQYPGSKTFLCVNNKITFYCLFISENNRNPFSSILYSCNKYILSIKGLPWWLSGKETADEGDVGSVPGLGRSPGEGNGNPLQDSCLENSKDRGTWWATVHGVAKSLPRLSTSAHALEQVLPVRVPFGLELLYTLTSLNH